MSEKDLITPVEEETTQEPLPYQEFKRTAGRPVFREHKEIKAARQTFTIPYEMIKPRPGFNIRTEENPGFSYDSLWELAELIKTNGLTPLEGDLAQIEGQENWVFWIEDGERRWRAIGLLREKGEVYDLVEVRPNPAYKTEKERLLSMLASDNKVPYRPIEIAEGVSRLKKNFQMTNKEIGDALSKSRQWVDNMVNLSKKPEDIKEQVRLGALSATEAILKPMKENSHEEDMHGITGKSKIATTKDRTIGEGSGNDVMNDVVVEKEVTEQEKLLKNMRKLLGKMESLFGGLNEQAQKDAENYRKWFNNDLDALDLFFSKRENRDSSRFITIEAINTLVKLVDGNRVSDGYHTFGELYDHRVTLYIALCNKIVEEEATLDGIQGSGIGAHGVWRTEKHSDGTSYEGWFVLGINKEAGKQITYHLPINVWDQCGFAETLEQAPEFDGHTPADVLERLKQSFQ